MTVLRYNRFYYDPLPSNVKIKKSDIHGYGIFAILYFIFIRDL